ncbi:MAG TPA: sugar transferase [Deltaproteobacteria bacterium]|nr:sugar transferase [Deltaproteobacteria bacterium]HPR56465.1 sugar transferase [Deltaproteobacteria bacterium]HXK48410.1 sugar transferase [Deltaproteobacteria bacterium]
MKRLFSAVILFALDLAVAGGSVYLAKYLQRLLPEVSLPDELLWLKACVYAAVTILCFYFQDLYDWKYWKKISELTSSILLAEGLTLIILAVVYYILPTAGLERDVLLMAIGLTFLLAFVFRVIYVRLRFTQYAGLRVIIFGDGENAKFLFREIRAGGYPVIFEGYIGRSNWDLPLRCLGDASELTALMKRFEPDILVVAPDGWRGTLPIEDLLRVKFTLGDVIDGPTFYEQVTGRILVEEIRPSSIIFTRGFQGSHFEDIIKRLFDLVFGLVGLVLTFPFMLLTALVIRLDSPGPIFYLQHRVGKDGKDFKVIKFRSMRVDAEKDGPKWASENDPRITRVGRIIRKLRIDELPQFINVIKNDMSFVGPRPERRYFVDQLEKAIPFYALRMHAKPGITGWAQINYPYGDTFEDAKEKLKFELYYMKHRSMWLDLVIIFQTVKVAVKGRGSQ